jgi:MFS family permease
LNLSSNHQQNGSRIYYGWVIVGVVVVSGVAAAASTLAVNGVFLKPITEEFGWSRATYSGATGIGTLIGALLALGAGPLVDRWGPRWPMVVGFLIVGGAFLGLASVTDLGAFYVFQATGRAAQMGLVSVGLMSTIPKWFVAARGRAVAVGSVGNGIGILGFPLFAQILIDAFDWRFAATVLGWAVWALALPPIVLFLRRKPEDMGMLPDGNPLQVAVSSSTFSPTEGANGEASFGLTQVLRHPSFYLLAIATTSGFMAFTATFFHMVPYLTDKGFEPVAAVTVVAVWSGSATVGTLVTGFYLDRYDSRLMLAWQLGLAGGAYLTLLGLNSLFTLILWAVAYGFIQGGMITTQLVIFANYYGRHHLGSIRGVTMPAFALGNAVGATGSALVFDITGSYLPVFWAFAGISMIGMVAALSARKPLQVAIGG